MIDYDDIPDPVVRVPIKVDPYKPVIISKEAYDKLPDYEKQYYEEWGKPCRLLGPIKESQDYQSKIKE